MPKWMTNSETALRSLRLLALTSMLMPMAACATLGRGTEVHYIDTSCQAFTALTYSSRDTPETVAEIKAHNRVFDKLCPSGGS